MQELDGWWFPDTERFYRILASTNHKMKDKGKARMKKKPSIGLHKALWENPLDDQGRIQPQRQKFDAAIEYLTEAQPRGCAVDIGAFVGHWTHYMAPVFKHVYAFEPVEDNAECWSKNMNIEGHKNVSLHEFAIGAEDGAIDMEIIGASMGNCYVSHGEEKPSGASAKNVNYVGTGKQVSYRRTLDSFNLMDVQFIKIDAEGSELGVVKGAKETIRRWRPLIILEQKKVEERYGQTEDAASEWLERQGMRQLLAMNHDIIMGWH